MSITVRTQTATLDIEAMQRAIAADISDRIQRAAIEYVSTAVSIIPVYSGASQATFTAIADALNLPLTISPRVNSRTDLGVNNSTGDLDLDGPVFSFEYTTELPHLVFNESNNANDFGFNLTNPGPYNFVARATAAAEDQVSGSISLPNQLTLRTRTFRLG